MKFNFEKWKDKKVCMHCQTEEEAIDFCKEMDAAGLRWADGTKYLHDISFYNNGSATVYYFNSGYYGSTYSVNDDVTILEWSDYMKEKVFTKDDLQTGDFVLLRNGSVFLVLKEQNRLISKDGWNPLGKVQQDLTYRADSGRNDYDIMKVYRPTDTGYSFNGYYLGELLYDRNNIKIKVTKKEIAEWKGISLEQLEIVD